MSKFNINDEVIKDTMSLFDREKKLFMEDIENWNMTLKQEQFSNTSSTPKANVDKYLDILNMETAKSININKI